MAARAIDHRALLELLAGRVPPEHARITPDGWDELDRIAQLHRFQPLLYHFHRDNPAIPDGVQQHWREAFRASALRALALQGDLADATGLLEAAGLAPIALKGAWLAWHAYPHPALRPMRDLDLLLTPETVIAGHRLLQEHGYAPLGTPEFAAEDAVRLDKHMPPLLSPRGTVIEIHHRLWEIDGRMDHSAPGANEAAIRGRAVRHGAITFLAPADLLAHLIIHAVYDHRLDCGPLVLADIAFLLRKAGMDWDRFWAAAGQQGWRKGAHLVLTLVRTHAPDVEIRFPADLGPLPPEHLGLAGELLLQELATRRSAGFAATLTIGGLGAMMSRVFARRSPKGDAQVARNLDGEGGYARWARTRLVRTLGELSHATVRRQSRQLASLSRWLDERTG